MIQCIKYNKKIIIANIGLSEEDIVEIFIPAPYNLYFNSYGDIGSTDKERNRKCEKTEEISVQKDYIKDLVELNRKQNELIKIKDVYNEEYNKKFEQSEVTKKLFPNPYDQVFANVKKNNS
jgi:hypothetical protein